MTKRTLVVTVPIFTLSFCLAGGLQAQNPEQGLVQRQADAYTRYELLEPQSQSFRILYDVSATTPDARFYFNPIRKGSEPAVHAVIDLVSGKPLEWKLVSASAAEAAGLMGSTHDGQFLQVSLARPVSEGGEGRIRIDKTYKDPASYFVEDAGNIVFERSLGVQRNAVVLPPRFELVGCNYPSQIATEEDGRIRVSFMGRGTSVPLRLVARPLSVGPKAVRTQNGGVQKGGQIEVREPGSRPIPESARTEFEVTERAFEDREIVYFLLQPETHSFRLYHDYTEKRPGVDRYLNVVRPGSRAKEPSATILDSGEVLEVETLRGREVTDKGLDIGEPVSAETEVVAIWFDPVGEGGVKATPHRGDLHRCGSVWSERGRPALGSELRAVSQHGRSACRVVAFRQFRSRSGGRDGGRRDPTPFPERSTRGHRGPDSRPAEMTPPARQTWD